MGMAGLHSKKGKRVRQLGAIERDILDELTFGDLLYAFLMSGRSTRTYFKLARERANYRYRRRLAIERLKELDYIKERGKRLTITNAGRSALGISIRKTRELLNTKTWDGKWRVVAFDIPERKKKLRDRVRGILKRVGFEQLQKSIWVFPHECEELVQLIKEESQLAPHILYGVLDTIEGEARLKNLFSIR
jgi:hypothetical protein